MNQEMLLENVSLRNKHMNRTDVLDKVKVLCLLPDDEHMTIRMVADYYEVDEGAIKMLIHRHREELDKDGLKNLTGIELSNMKLLCDMKANRSRAMIVLTRRAVLRIGMLLRDSEVAKQIRTYLLNVEQESSQQQRVKSVKGSKWDGKELILYDRIVVGISQGKSLTEICREVAPKIGESTSKCMTRYSQFIKKKIQNEELIKQIESNKGKKLSIVVPINPVEDSIKSSSNSDMTFSDFIQINMDTNQMIKQLLEDHVGILKQQLEKANKENQSLRVRHKKVLAELKQVQAVVASAIKVGVNETLQQTFKMDVNGNLERI